MFERKETCPANPPVAARLETAPEVEPAADSAIARVVDRAFENPAMSGGLMVMAITAMAIVSNALFLQAGRHPEPLFATRPAATAPAPAGPPRPFPCRTRASRRPRQSRRRRRRPPRHRRPRAALRWIANKVSSPPCSASLPVSASIPVPSTASTGPRTKAAIATWQTAAGIEATGEPTPELLAALRKPVAAAPPAAAPVPAVVKEAASTDQVAAAVARAEELEREQAALAQGKQLRQVQEALNLIGYGPLTVDGQRARRPATPSAASSSTTACR